MAQIDPEKIKRGVLSNVLKEMQRSKSGAFEKVASEAMAKAREGRGLITGAIAAEQARRAAAREYRIATEGTLGKRQAFFEGLLGQDLGKMFKTLGWEKMESAERIKEAREKFGLDKKEKSEKGGKGGAGNLSKPLSIILRKILETQKIVLKIEKILTKPRLKAGFTFDPKMSGGGRFKETATGKIVSADLALETEQRTDALSKAIAADEEPLTNLRKEFNDKFKDFDAEEVQNDLNNIQTLLLLLLAKAGIPTPNLPNRRKPAPAPKPGESGKPGEKPTPKPGEKPTTPKPGEKPTTPKPKPGEKPTTPKPSGRIRIPEGVKTAGRFLGRFGGIAAAGFIGYDAYEGFTNAEETLGLQKGAEATAGQKLASAAGSVVSGMTFGLVDAGNVGRFISGTEENPTDANLEKYVTKKDASVNLSGLKPEMQKRLAGLAYEYNQKTGKKIQINSGYRDPKEQAQLYAKYGPPRAAPPGRSRHESGLAVDINSADADKATQLGLMAKYGFTRPVPGETWHVEPVEVARKNPTPDNPYSPGAPVAVANAGGKAVAPDSGKKPPPAITAVAKSNVTPSPSTTPKVESVAAAPKTNRTNTVTNTNVQNVVSQNSNKTVTYNQIQPVQNITGEQVAQSSAQLESSKMVSQAVQTSPVIINNKDSGPKNAIEPPKTPLTRGSSRSDESSFNRALAKDFSHPTAFTSVIVA